MLKKVKEIKKTELLVLLSWLKGELTFTGKPFNYYHLLEECNKDVENIFVENDFENLLLELYPIYEKLKKTSIDKLEETMEESPMFKILPKDIIDESMRKIDAFFELYINLIISSSLDDITLKGKQKTLLNEKLDDYVKKEEYEKCIDLKKILKEIE